MSDSASMTQSWNMKMPFSGYIHQLHRFEHNGRTYVADLDKARIIPADDVVWKVAEMMSASTKSEIIKALGKEFSPGRIYEAFAFIEEFAYKFGIFYTCNSERRPEKPDIARVFLTRISVGAFSNTAIDIHNKIRFIQSLADNMSLVVEPPLCSGVVDQDDYVPTDVKDLVEILPPMGSNRTSFTQVLADRCNAILVTAPRPYFDIPAARMCNLPCMTRIPTSYQYPDQLVNVSLVLDAGLRESDILCIDYSWARDCILPVISENRELLSVPNGIDLELFRPVSRADARSTLADILNREIRQDQPVVGIESALATNSHPTVTEVLASMHPNVLFIILSQSCRIHIERRADNIEVLDLGSLSDVAYLPIVLNGIDVLLFKPRLGANGEILLESMACHVPIIVIGGERCLPETGNAGIYCEFTNSSHNSIHNLDRKLTELLEDYPRRCRRGASIQESITDYSWRSFGKKVRGLIYQMLSGENQAQLRNGTPHIQFRRYYDRGSGEMRTIAVGPPERQAEGASIAVSPEEGLVLALSDTHTPREIEVILSHIMKGRKQARALMNSMVHRESYQHVFEAIRSYDSEKDR